MAPPRLAGLHLVVIGLRASGKSTAGELAAARLGLPCEDLDELTIQDVNGMMFASVCQAWQSAGEKGFRDAETKALRRALMSEQHDILALGGGTPAFAAARRVLTEAMEAGVVLGPVYLHASPEVLAERLRQEVGDRPTLTGVHPADEIAGIYDQRDAIYRALAAEIVEVGELPVEAVAQRLVELWSS